MSVMRKVKLIRCIECRLKIKMNRFPFSTTSRQFTTVKTIDFDNDSVKDAMLIKAANDPTFLLGVIQKLRGERNVENPKNKECIDILSDFILHADSNKDGVVTRDELTQWLRRTPGVVINEGVRYVPINDESLALNEPVCLHPTDTQLRQHFVRVAVPFVGFGFLDNFIMILSGAEIEAFFGLSLGLSAMAAAGLGNTLSDIIGIQAGGVIEAMSDKMGMKDPNLTKEQLKSKFIRILTMIASMLGITIGCLLGMFPLLFMENADSDRSIRLLFDTVDTNNNKTLELKELDVLFDRMCQQNLIDQPQEARDFMRSCGFEEHDSLDFMEFKQLYNAYVHKRIIENQVDKRKTTRLQESHD